MCSVAQFPARFSKRLQIPISLGVCFVVVVSFEGIQALLKSARFVYVMFVASVSEFVVNQPVFAFFT